jgi:hypothetical protein
MITSCLRTRSYHDDGPRLSMSQNDHEMSSVDHEAMQSRPEHTAFTVTKVELNSCRLSNSISDKHDAQRRHFVSF